MSRTIHLNDSFFGHDVGIVDDDGTVKLPNAIWGSHTVGHLERDGIYVPTRCGKRKVIDITHGHMYLLEDAGPFSRGTWVGSISSDGEVRDTDRRVVAELRKSGDGSDVIDEIFGEDKGGEADGEPDSSRKTGAITDPEPIIGLALLKAVGIVLVPMAMWAVISRTPALLTSESVSAGGKMGLVIALLLTAATVAFVSLKSEQSVLSTLVECLGAGTLAATLSFGAYALIADPPTGFGDWLLFLLFMPFVCFCWSAATSVIIALPICGVRAVMRE